MAKIIKIRIFNNRCIQYGLFKLTIIKLRLPDFYEIIGVLTDILYKENEIILSFNINKNISIPKNDFSYNNLYSFIGKNIGILNAGGIYKIRCVKIDK